MAYVSTPCHIMATSYYMRPTWRTMYAQQFWVFEPVAMWSSLLSTMVSPHRLKQRWFQIPTAMQMQSPSFFANIRITSRGSFASLSIPRFHSHPLTTTVTWTTMWESLETTWCTCRARQMSPGRWAYRLGELMRLFNQGQRYAMAVLRTKRSQLCHQAHVSLHPNNRRCAFKYFSKVKWILEH